MSSDLCEALKGLIPPEVASGFDKPLDASDYQSYLDKCGKEFPLLTDSLKTYFEKHLPLPLSKDNVDLISSVVIVCGAHSKPFLWTSFSSLQSSDVILKCLVASCQLKSVEEVLMLESAAVLRKVLKILRPKLLKSTWKMNMPAVEVYEWLLYKIEPSLLNDLLDDVLPTALIVADDFETKHKVRGVKCLHYIASNVERSDLAHGERGQLIYKTLEPMLFYKEVDIIKVLFPCLVSLFSKIYPHGTYDSTEYGCIESVLESMLSSMFLETKLAVREAYLSVLPLVITSGALSSVRFSSQILDVLEEYTIEPTSSLKALKCLESFLRVAWPILICFN